MSKKIILLPRDDHVLAIDAVDTLGARRSIRRGPLSGGGGGGGGDGPSTQEPGLVVRRVPLVQVCQGHAHQPVGVGARALVDVLDLGPDAVASPPGEERHPEVVVDAAYGEAVDEEDEDKVPGPELGPAQAGPLPAAADQIDADGHGQVEDAVRVGLEADDKLEGVAGGRRDDHDKGHGPLEQVGAERGAEGAGRDPKVGVGQHALAADLADHARGADEDGQQVAKGAEQDQDVEGRLGGAAAEHGGEEDGGGDLPGGGELGLGYGGKVGDVAEHVQHRHDEDRGGGVPLELGDRVPDLVDHVEGVGIARVGEDDVDQRHRQAVAVGRGALEGVAEVAVRVRDAADVAAQDHEARDADEDERRDLERPDHVGRPERVLVVRHHADHGQRVGRDGDAPHLPLGRGHAGDAPHVPRQHDGVGGAERQDHRLHRKRDGEEVLWARVGLFQVHHLAAAAVGEVRCELQVDADACDGHDDSDEPVDQSQTDRASPVEYGSSCGKYARANHLVDVEENDGHPAHVVSQRRLALDRSTDGLLIRRTRAIAGLDSRVGELAVVNHGWLRVGSISRRIGCRGVSRPKLDGHWLLLRAGYLTYLGACCV
ncbi:uncharacterized protein PpBr36_06213 [Pyricularia pennisetigena]|uniref:uncharacterized protein n=1 Tax=Pyricularia pennisetigena TaxID=1578925 RepID=UPI00114DFD96|nr:uncharacterized protein PpBr36_06213 [Pyricularia pennisetigena]TLS23167.1 hypothetical protein PpBr36_06213 [Pyricularia pennisetigena]